MSTHLPYVLPGTVLIGYPEATMHRNLLATLSVKRLAYKDNDKEEY